MSLCIQKMGSPLLSVYGVCSRVWLTGAKDDGGQGGGGGAEIGGGGGGPGSGGGGGGGGGGKMEGVDGAGLLNLASLFLSSSSFSGTSTELVQQLHGHEGGQRPDTLDRFGQHKPQMGVKVLLIMGG